MELKRKEGDYEIFTLIQNQHLTALADKLQTCSKRELAEWLLATDGDGNTAFQFACLREDEEVASLLLSAACEADVVVEMLNSCNQSKLSGLDIAVHYLVDSHIIPDILNKLHDKKKAFRETVVDHKLGGQSLMHYACFFNHFHLAKCILEVLDEDATVDVLSKVNSQGATPLHVACTKDRPETLSVILLALRHTPILDKVLFHQSNGDNILHIACREKCSKITEVILNIVDLRSLERLLLTQNTKRATPLQISCYSNNPSFVENVLERFTDPEALYNLVTFQLERGESMLHTACHQKCLEITKLVLEALGDRRLDAIRVVSTKKQENALHRAVTAMGNFNLIVEIMHYLSSDSKIVSEVVLQKDYQGNNVFHHMCKYGLCNAASLIWECCASDTRAALLEAVNDDNESCFHMLCGGGSSSNTILEMMLDDLPKNKYSQVMSLQTKSLKQTCLHYAFRSGNLEAVKLGAALLLDKVSVDLEDTLSKKDANGQTCLHVACKAGQHQLLEALFQMGLNMSEEYFYLFESTDDERQTPLHLACGSDQSQELVGIFTKQLSAYHMSRLLRLQDCHGNSALHVACHDGCIPAIKSLLESCKEYIVKVLRVQNKNGETFLHIGLTKHIAVQLLQIVFSLPLAVEELKTVLFLPNNSDQTALMACVRCHNVPFIKLLEMLETKRFVEYFLQGMYDDETSFAMHLFTYVLREGDVVLVRLLLDKYCFELLTAENSLRIFGTLVECESEECKTLFFKYAEIADNITLGVDTYSLKVYRTAVDNVRMLHNEIRKQPRTDLLELIRGTSLESEPYILQYLSKYWSSAKLVRGIFWTTWFVYIMCLLLLTTYVTGHSYRQENYNTTQLVFDTSYAGHISGYLLIVFAAINLAIDVLFMLTVSKHKLKRSLQNCFNLAVSLLCIAVAVVGCVKYGKWQHLLGTCTMFFAYTRLALAITTLPSFIHTPCGMIRKYISERFLLAFRVIYEVLKFMPVVVVFLLTFALCFLSLGLPNVMFNPNHIVIKLAAMSIGEFDLSDIIPAEYFPFTVATNVLLVIYMFVMTICVMNLLVAIALNELHNLQKQSDTQAFRNFLYVVEEVQCIIDLCSCVKGITK